MMQGKVLIVTGALGALGKVVAEIAQSRGARVAGIDHAPSQISATPERIEIGGVDLPDAEQAKTAVEAAARHFGNLDVLVNIAAASPSKPSATAPPRRGSACMRSTC